MKKLYEGGQVQRNNLPSIKYGSIPQIILIGNGINRSFGAPDWTNLIMKTTDKESLPNTSFLEQVKTLPYPLQPVVLTGDKVDGGLEQLAEQLTDVSVCAEQADLILNIVSKEADAILTTNYTYEIEKSLDTAFECKIKRTSKFRKNTHVPSVSKAELQLGIFHYNEIITGESSTRVWHIHGEAARPGSMILGHYYYGKLLSLIQKQISGVIRRYKAANKLQQDFQPRSWIDYFLIGDVYIAGFGFDFSEMDLWWLVIAKKRTFPDAGKIFFYEPMIQSVEKQMLKALAEAYGVNLPVINFDGDFKAYLIKVGEDIHERILETEGRW